MVIGMVAEKLTPFHMPGDWAGDIVAGFIGAWLGPLLFGTWGPMLLGFYRSMCCRFYCHAY